MHRGGAEALSCVAESDDSRRGNARAVPEYPRGFGEDARNFAKDLRQRRRCVSNGSMGMNEFDPGPDRQTVGFRPASIAGGRLA